MTAQEDFEAKRAIAWRVFFDASTRVQGVLEARLRKFANLSPSDYNLMLMLYESSKYQLRLRDLGEALAISPSRLSYQINRLVKEELVEKYSSKQDARYTHVKLTDKGIEVTQEATEIHRNVVRQSILDELSDENINSIVEVFKEVHGRRKT